MQRMPMSQPTISPKQRGTRKTPFSRRSLLRGAIAVAAATSLPLQRGVAAEATARTGELVLLSGNALEDLQKSIAGNVILPTSPDYDQARRLWNPAVDRHPAVIVRCTSVNDIQAALQFGRSHDILTAVRCGGHNVGGTGMAQGGLTIDLSLIRGVEVDRSKQIAKIKGGSLLRDLDQATVPMGLATTAGVVSHTGVGGLATVLGQGRLGRKFGYTIDNIRGVTVITPDGRSLRADATTNSDLYWGIRGGGGNFGIVTEFELQLHEFDPNVTSFSFTYPVAKAADALKVLFELGKRVPRETSVSGSLRTSAEGETTVSISGTHLGSAESAQQVLGRYLDPLGKPLRNRLTAMNYGKLQSIADGALFAPRSQYSQSGFFHRVDEHMAEAIAEYVSKYPMPGTAIRMSQQGGKGNDLAPTATAFPHRDTLFQCTVDAQWTDPSDAKKYRQYADHSWDVIGAMGNGGFYVNVAVDPTELEIRRAYAGNYSRLVALKRKYDPTNFLRVNVNINPDTI
jgi:FAD/FMN-containing dehydrogenase